MSSPCPAARAVWAPSRERAVQQLPPVGVSAWLDCQVKRIPHCRHASCACALDVLLTGCVHTVTRHVAALAAYKFSVKTTHAWAQAESASAAQPRAWRRRAQPRSRRVPRRERGARAQAWASRRSPSTWRTRWRRWARASASSTRTSTGPACRRWSARPCACCAWIRSRARSSRPSTRASSWSPSVLPARAARSCAGPWSRVRSPRGPSARPADWGWRTRPGQRDHARAHALDAPPRRALAVTLPTESGRAPRILSAALNSGTSLLSDKWPALACSQACES